MFTDEVTKRVLDGILIRFYGLNYREKMHNYAPEEDAREAFVEHMNKKGHKTRYVFQKYAVQATSPKELPLLMEELTRQVADDIGTDENCKKVIYFRRRPRLDFNEDGSYTLSTRLAVVPQGIFE